MNDIRPSRTFDDMIPMPAGYEIQSQGNTVLAVDPAGVKPTLYYVFSFRDRGWHPWPLQDQVVPVDRVDRA
jgi:hypothetical protein